MKGNPYTVKELIEILEKMPQDSHVYMNACDGLSACFGGVRNVEDDGDGDVVLETEYKQ